MLLQAGANPSTPQASFWLLHHQMYATAWKSVVLHAEVESVVVTGLVTFYHKLSFLAGRALLNRHPFIWDEHTQALR